MDVAVVIPFRGNPEILSWTLDGFARQELPPDVALEVRVCGDGCTLPPMPTQCARGVRFSPMTTERVGAAEARNLLLRNKPADFLIIANSDTRPMPDMVARHVTRLQSLPPGHLVLGAAPYERSATPTVFDVLMEESPMIFFYSQLQPGECHGFRNCWTLNLSLRYQDIERIGFFDARLRPCFYEDLDLGFRLLGPDLNRIYYDPAAIVTHRHPMTFDGYLNREEVLGLMAPVLHDANRPLFTALFGNEPLEKLTTRYRDWCQLDRPMHSWIYRRMQEWITLPAETLGSGDHRQRLLMSLYQMHVPLKRFAFRQGFLRGIALRDDNRWKERVSTGAWRLP